MAYKNQFGENKKYQSGGKPISDTSSKRKLSNEGDNLLDSVSRRGSDSLDVTKMGSNVSGRPPGVIDLYSTLAHRLGGEPPPIYGFGVSNPNSASSVPFPG